MVKDRFLIQVIVLSPPDMVCPGKQDTSTTVPTMTGKFVEVLVKLESKVGSPLHVSEREIVKPIFHIPRPYYSKSRPWMNFGWLCSDLATFLPHTMIDKILK